MTQEEVTKKIQKLMRLSQSPNEEEAASALAKAHKLLREYHLEMSQVLDSVFDTQNSEIKEEKTWTDIKFYKWERQLLIVVAAFNYCSYYSCKSMNSRGHNVYIVGRPVNVQATKMMHEYLKQTAIRLSKDEADRTSFIMGMVARFEERFKEIRWAEHPTNSRELQVIETEAEEYMSHLKIHKVCSKIEISDIAYTRGYRAANSVNLNEQLA